MRRKNLTKREIDAALMPILQERCGALGIDSRAFYEDKKEWLYCWVLNGLQTRRCGCCDKNFNLFEPFYPVFKRIFNII